MSAAAASPLPFNLNFALYEALSHEDSEKVKSLLGQKANPNATDFLCGQNALHVVSRKSFHDEKKQLEITRLLLGAHADPISKTVKFSDDLPYWDTPLHFAAAQGNIELLRLLMKNSFLMNPSNSIDRSPLQEALYNKQQSTSDMLLKEYGSLRIENDYDSEGRTLLYIATKQKQYAIMKKILGLTKEILNTTTRFGFSPLLMALSNNDEKAASILLKSGASVTKTYRDGHTALHCAAAHSSPTIIRLLLQAGADLHAKNKDGYTPTQIAIKHGKQDNITALARKEEPSSSESSTTLIAQPSTPQTDVVCMSIGPQGLDAGLMGLLQTVQGRAAEQGKKVEMKITTR